MSTFFAVAHGLTHAARTAPLGGLIALAVVLSIMAAGMLPAILPMIVRARRSR